MDNIEKALIAERMAETIEERGHCVLFPENDSGQVCLLGAGRLAQNIQANPITVGEIEDGKASWEQAQTLHYAQSKADKITAEVFGYENPDNVWQLNDGRGYNQSLDKETAIDKCVERAKYWREQG